MRCSASVSAIFLRPPERKIGATYPQLYRKAGAVPRLHLLLLKDPPVFAVGSRHAAVFPRVTASGPSDGPEYGELGFIERTPGQGRLVWLLVPRDQLPDLM